VDTDDKKKDCFIIGLSTKRQERMALNTGGSFPEFISNVIIVVDVIHAHKEAKKRKVVVAPQHQHHQRTVYHSAPRYRMVYHTAPPTRLISTTTTSVSGNSGLPTSAPALAGSI
jgi:hypothetical protein